MGGLSSAHGAAGASRLGWGSARRPGLRRANVDQTFERQRGPCDSPVVRLRLYVKIAQILLTAVAGALLYARAFGLPSASFWAHNELALYWIIGSSVAAAFLLAVAEILDARFSIKSDRVALVCLRQLIATMHLILEDPNLQPQRVGMHVFLTGWTRVKWRPRKIHRRVARLRLAGAPDDSGMLFTKGKGFVGMCWEQKAAVHGDWSETWQKYQTFSRDEWLRLPPSETQGFTYEEFRLTGPEYGAVVVLPIIDAHEKYYGCVAIDGPPGYDQYLWTVRVRGRLYVCARAILSALKPRAPISA